MSFPGAPGSVENIARFNMPLELGMAMACRLINPGSQHDGLVLVPSAQCYVGFVSDLAAHAPLRHEGSVRGVVVVVMSCLGTRADAKASHGVGRD